MKGILLSLCIRGLGNKFHSLYLRGMCIGWGLLEQCLHLLGLLLEAL